MGKDRFCYYISCFPKTLKGGQIPMSVFNSFSVRIELLLNENFII